SLACENTDTPSISWPAGRITFMSASRTTLSDASASIRSTSRRASPLDTISTVFVWYEIFGDVHAAIAREKQLKHWRREKKIRLIECKNPTWQDFSAEWGKPISWQDINRRSLHS